jgi:hypothetical protein
LRAADRELAFLDVLTDHGEFVVTVREHAPPSLNRSILISCVAGCQARVRYTEESSQTPRLLWASPMGRPVIILVSSSGSSNIVRGFSLGKDRVESILSTSSQSVPVIRETRDELVVETMQSAEGSASGRLEPVIWRLDAGAFRRQPR